MALTVLEKPSLNFFNIPNIGINETE